MKNKILLAIAGIILCIATFLVLTLLLGNKIISSNVQSKETNMWSYFPTSSIPTDLKTELIEKVKNQIAQKRDDNVSKDILITFAFSRSNVIGGIPELIIGTWKNKKDSDILNWFAYSDRGVWKIFVIPSDQDCEQVKTLPDDVIRQLIIINLPFVKTCNN